MVAPGEIFSILLVEDNLEDLVLFKKSLEQDRRFPSRVDSAETIVEAIEKLKRNSYHLVLVEGKLQEQDGLDLLHEMQEAHVDLPFVLMTSIRDDRLVREAMNQGVADLIIKSESQFQFLAAKLRESYQKFYQKRSRAGPEENPEKAEDAKSSFDDVEELPERPSLNGEYAAPAIRDELTGVFNHGYIHDRIVREFSRASRYSYPLSCLMVDIDHFKTINEQKGYRSGDMLLREFARLIFESCRLSDLVGRYGGSEFLVLLPHISYEGAQELAKRVRTTFAEHVFLSGTEDIKITISIGISSFPEDAMSRRADLINYSRRALLHAKATGRNRSILFRDMAPVLEAKMPKLEISEKKVSGFQRRITEVADSARRECLKVSTDLIHTLESKDRFTAGHGTNCAAYARQVADVMGLSIEEVEVIQNAALLHDIGKICIPDAILLKPAKLTFNEYEIMKQHAYYGYKILTPIKSLREEALIILHHHEWFNGTGYPCHLSGEEIPLGARIIGVIDAYDTMRMSGGRYRKTISVDEAVIELVNMSGAQFDPNVVKYFIAALKMRRDLSNDCYDKELLERNIKEAAHKKMPA